MVDSTVLQTVEGFDNQVLPFVPRNDDAKMNLILEYIAGKSAPGKSVALDPDVDYPISFSQDPCEFDLLFRTLIEKKLLEEVVSGQPKIRVILTVNGRQRINALSKPPIGFRT